MFNLCVGFIILTKEESEKEIKSMVFLGKLVSFRSTSPTKIGSYLRNKKSKQFAISFM